MQSITPPEGFRHQYALQVRWGDMDALGHVNNARFLTYIEQARFDYFRAGLGRRYQVGDRPGFILVKVVLEFKQPLFESDDVHIFTRCIRLGGSSFDLEHWVMRLKDGQLEAAAQATITSVVYDYVERKSVPIPDALRAAIKAYEVAAPNE